MLRLDNAQSRIAIIQRFQHPSESLRGERLLWGPFYVEEAPFFLREGRRCGHPSAQRIDTFALKSEYYAGGWE